jgi:hypothetical protein
MTEGLSLSSEVRVFPCPNCRQTINTSMQKCAFCSMPIDRAVARASAAATSRISRACNDASYLKIMAGCALIFFFLRFVPLITPVGFMGFLFLEFAIPVMTVRWWIKYGRIQTDDPDFSDARLNATYVAGGVFLFLLYIATKQFFLV